MIRFVVASITALPLIASAATYTTISPENSNVVFHYQQMGVDMEGRFTKLDGEITFDSEKPEEASLTLRVNMNSADTGSDEADSEIVKKEWFNASDFPAAVFTSKAVTAKKDNTFEVAGVLDIKGHKQDILLPVTAQEEPGRVIFTGSFPLLRGDYAIGEGAWSAYDIVANDIRVDFTVVATE